MNHPYLKHSDNHTVATILDNPQYKPLERTWHHQSYERQSDKAVLHVVKSTLFTKDEKPAYMYFFETGTVGKRASGISYATKETILDLFGIEL